MLIALFTWLALNFFGGASGSLLPADFNKNLKSAIEEKQDRKPVEQIAKDMDKLVAEYNKDLKKIAEGFTKALRDPATDDETLHSYAKQLVDRRKKAQRDVLEMRMRLRDAMTREQWQAAFAASE